MCRRPWEGVSWEELYAGLCTQAPTAARLDLRREGPFFPFLRAEFKSGKLLHLDCLAVARVCANSLD